MMVCGPFDCVAGLFIAVEIGFFLAMIPLLCLQADRPWWGVVSWLIGVAAILILVLS